MSSITYISDDTATLVSAGPALLLSVAIGTTEPPPAGLITIDFHNVATAGATLTADNRKIRLSMSANSSILNHTFDGIVFSKGLVVKASGSLHINVEFD